jgi:hypothetical protein
MPASRFRDCGSSSGRPSAEGEISSGCTISSGCEFFSVGVCAGISRSVSRESDLLSHDLERTDLNTCKFFLP